VVAFHILPLAYRIMADWIERHGHHLALLVTTPGPSTRRNTIYHDLIAGLPPRQDILISTHMQRVADHVRAVEPDLIVSFTFPYRIPPEVRAIPRLGAVNLHPTPLPRYRGPNPWRMIFDGSPAVGATLHWMDDEFDTGHILSVREEPLAVDAEPEAAYGVWAGTMAATMEEGLARALAGEPGWAQDPAQASYGARFEEHEQWLHWDLPGEVLKRRVTSLAMLRQPIWAMVDDDVYTVSHLQRLDDISQGAVAGTVLDWEGDVLTIAVAGGAVRVTLARADEAAVR
jgi:methionyl-tRNA formyltransferase